MSDARIVNVSSGVGSLTTNADPAFPYHAMFGPIYPASKAALNAITLAMMIELESTDIKINLVSPAFTSTNLNGYAGTESVKDGSREVVRVALLGPDGPTGTFTRWENTTIPVVEPPDGNFTRGRDGAAGAHRRKIVDGCKGPAGLLRDRSKTAEQAGKPELTPFSSAKESAGSDITAPMASAVLADSESRDRNCLLPS